MTTTRTQRKLLMRACRRCHGDLLHDDYEDEYTCLQCGRRADLTSGQPVATAPNEAIKVITAPPVFRALTRAEARRRRDKTKAAA
jgi:hypothetical protein